jgi:membrane associated rhomboid family serine protease/Zn-finger nucleic acid-binding protein
MDRRCPRCTFTLVPQPINGSEIDFCPRCHGAFIEPGEGGALLGAFGDVSSWAQLGVARPVGDSPLRCPTGHGKMNAWRVNAPDGTDVEVDTCATCRGLWLDNSEAQRLKKAGAHVATTAAISIPRFEPGMRLNEPPPGQEKTGVGWYLFQLFTAMPIEVYNPKRKAAVVCLSLIAACFVVFGIEIVAIGAGDEKFLYRFGAVTSDLLRGRNLHAAVTHMFLHGGIMHILGNMWFLWTFGDNVEDRVGRVRFTILYLVFGFAALILQMILGGDPNVPLVGASGAISGLMGAYLGLFPRARVYQVIFFIRWKMPAWLYLGGWAALNALVGAVELGNHAKGAGVAWWAHVGGFVAGLAWALILGRKFRDGAELHR